MSISEVLENIFKNEKFSGIIATTGNDAISNVEGLTTKTSFKTHSVGKIFSGILMAEMLAQGIIDENILEKKEIEIPKSVTEKLKDQPAVLERLSQVSILQAMTHKANLGDCLDVYLDRLYRHENLPNSMEDLPELVTNNWRKNYSNDGLLFGGIALQHIYNQKTGEDLSYEQLLKKLVIEPSGTNISMTKPEGAYHDENMVDFPASPAGGHYASIEDLQKFGAYLCERCKDQNFMNIVKKYGSEFYNAEKNMIAHKGDFEGSQPDAPGSATGFGVFLDSGKTVALFTNIDASLNDRINRTMTQCHGHGFFNELVKELELQGVEQGWTERFTKKQSSDLEGGTVKKSSWKEILNKPNKSKDDSSITR